MKNKLKRFGQGFLMLGLAAFLSYGCGAKEKMDYQHPPAIHLSKDSITDFGKQVKMAKNWGALIRYPAEGVEHLEVSYLDRNMDSKIDEYSVVFYGCADGGPVLTHLVNKEYAEEMKQKGFAEVLYRDIMDEELQKVINQEYKQLTEQQIPPALIHLGKNSEWYYKIQKHDLFNPKEGLAKVQYPWGTPPRPPHAYLEAMYISLGKDANVDIYSVNIMDGEGNAHNLTEFYSEKIAEQYKSGGGKAMSEELQKEINQEYGYIRIINGSSRTTE